MAHTSLVVVGCLDSGDYFVRSEIGRHPFLARHVAYASPCLLSIAHLRQIEELYLSALPKAIPRRSSGEADFLSEQLLSLWSA